MKKLLSCLITLSLLIQLAAVTALAKETFPVFDTASFVFNAENVINNPEDATFTVPSGKTVKTLTLDGNTISEGDGVTKWDTFPCADKNYTYDASTGIFTISRRFIGVDTDLYGKRSLDFVLEFTDGEKGILRLNGVYNYLKFEGTVQDYSKSNTSGYNKNEMKPTSSWAVCSTSAREKALNLIDGVTNQYHSYYKNEGTSIIFRDNVPHYIDIDTGAATKISGVMYKPRNAGTGGCFTSVIYQGSDDGINFTDIKEDTYAGDLSVKVTHFSENVTYRYYRVKVENAISGYGTGDEIHFLKPALSISDKTIDVSGSFDASFPVSLKSTVVSEALVNGEALPDNAYTISPSSLKLSEDYIKTLPLGDYMFKFTFEDSYAEFNIKTINSALALADAKSNAKAELESYGTDVSSYLASVDSALTPDAVTEILDSAATTLGAKTINLPYRNTLGIKNATVLSETVSDEGKASNDTNVVTCATDIITATGLGRAIVKSEGKLYLVKTTAADIALVIVSGQSNAAGDSSDYTEAPSAIGKYKGRYLVTNSMNCALPVSGVTIEEATYTAEHGGRPSDSFISETWSQKGWSAAEASQLGARLSDEWNMTVWVINTGICARIMDDFDPAKATHNAYSYTVSYVNKAKEAVSADPHYILDESKTGFFWLQGCSDGIGTASANTMEEYTEMFMNMYKGWKKEIGINYAGIWLVRAGVNSGGDKDFYMSGPRLSQFYLGNSAKEEHKNIYLIMNTDIWRTNEGVSDYFTEKYPDAEAFKAYYGYDRPSTYAEVKPDLHHRQKGYNELGDEAGDVIADIMNKTNAVPECAALFGYDGNEVPMEGFTLKVNESVLAVPVSTTTYFNASFNLTVSVDNENVASFDNDTFTLKGIGEGKTVARIKYDSMVLASYTVTVSGVSDEILSERSKWTITASSIEGTRGNPYNLVDGSTATSFVADIKIKTPPHHFEILLPEKAEVSGVGFDSYTDANGYPLKYEIYASAAGDDEYELIKSGSFDRASDALTLKSQTIEFGKNVTLRKLKFVFTETVNGYAAMSEFYIYSGKSAHAKNEVSEIRLTIGNSTITKVTDGVDVPVQFDVAPIIREGRTYVPVRGIFEIAGAEILWDGEKRAATVKTDSNEVVVIIDNPEAFVNGKAAVMDAPPVIIDGRTLIPLRFISENLGYEVSWDGETQTVTIKL